jgi:hypothetical protein
MIRGMTDHRKRARQPRPEAVRPTQRELAERLLDLLAPDAAVKRHAEQLGGVLEAAQNRPPEGTSDGSLTELQWVALRDVQKAAANLAGAVDAARLALRGNVAKQERGS